MAERLKILYLVGTDPRSTSYGGEQRTHFIWEGLKKVADVYTVIPVARKRQERVDEKDQIRWICFERRWTPGWILRRIWQRFFPRIGLPCGGAKEKINNAFPFSFDACVVRYVTMASYLKAWQIAPMVLDVDDFESERCRSMCSNRLRRGGRIIIKIIRSHENKMLQKAAHAWVVNTDHLPLVTGQCPVSLLPNIPLRLGESLAETCSDGHVLVTVGLMGHPPNYLGVDFFLRHHWRKVLDSFPDAVYKIAGAGLPKQYAAMWSQYKNVQVLGFVKDLHNLYRQAVCVLVPIDTGSGSCIKVLEALSIGRVCFVTPFAARGVPAEEVNRVNGLFLFERAEEMIAGIKTLENTDRRLEFQRGGKAFVTCHYSQEKVDAIINNTIQSCGCPNRERFKKDVLFHPKGIDLYPAQCRIEHETGGRQCES